MHQTTSGSKWMAVLAVVLLTAAAWTALRTPNDSLPGTPVVSEPARGLRAPSALEAPPPMAVYPDFLPAEAIDTLRLIERGGPYPYRQDDGVFGNREGRLPPQARGHYREYTVETPGSPDRGARRIIAGGRPPVEYFYTDDHYRSFRPVMLNGNMLDGSMLDGSTPDGSMPDGSAPHSGGTRR